MSKITFLYCCSSCHKTSKSSSESESWDLRMHKFGQRWAQIALAKKGTFLVNWLIFLWSNCCTTSYGISKFLERKSWDIIAWGIRLYTIGSTTTRKNPLSLSRPLHEKYSPQLNTNFYVLTQWNLHF